MHDSYRAQTQAAAYSYNRRGRPLFAVVIVLDINLHFILYASAYGPDKEAGTGKKMEGRKRCRNAGRRGPQQLRGRGKQTRLVVYAQ